MSWLNPHCIRKPLKKHNLHVTPVINVLHQLSRTVDSCQLLSFTLLTVLIPKFGIDSW